MLTWESVAVLLAGDEREDEFKRCSPPDSGGGVLGGVYISDLLILTSEDEPQGFNAEWAPRRNKRALTGAYCFQLRPALTWSWSRTGPVPFITSNITQS